MLRREQREFDVKQHTMSLTMANFLGEDFLLCYSSAYTSMSSQSYTERYAECIQERGTWQQGSYEVDTIGPLFGKMFVPSSLNARNARSLVPSTLFLLKSCIK